MSSISAQDVAKLRQMSGAGMMDAKKALTEASGDFDKAVELLRKKGQANAAKRAGRTAMQGLVDSYIHPGGRIGVIVEVNCETDFVARNEIFITLVRDIALHIAGASPLYVSREEIPQEIVDKERAFIKEQVAEQDKPAELQEKIVEGKLDKFQSEVSLLEQPFVKDPNKTIAQLIEEQIATIGENIQVRRFTRYELAG